MFKIETSEIMSLFSVILYLITLGVIGFSGDFITFLLSDWLCFHEFQVS